MKIEQVDFFYVAMPDIEDKGDGSQDALLVRVRAGGLEGWGECEASPLVSIAAYVAPMSHSGLKPLAWSVEGETIDSPKDIKRIRENVLRNSFDLLQAPHTLSGIDIALWNLLGQKEGAPVYILLGHKRAYPKTAYASMLFGETPAATFAEVRRAASLGYRAVKLGWGPFGRNLLQDAAQLDAARAAAGADTTLLIDAGTVWALNPAEAENRLDALRRNNVQWLEEPFAAYDYDLYKRLAERSGSVHLAGGEGSHNPEMARHLIDYGGIRYIQIDTGRIGGITPAVDVARYARSRNVVYVNHTFTTSLALSASIQPFAGEADWTLCEVPFSPSVLARELNAPGLLPDADGLLRLPETPGLGVPVHLGVVKKYLVPMTISAGGRVLYHSPEL
jgi:L-alanine-DL-glutamate epimerase-like enolase superfamily enzyme